MCRTHVLFVCIVFESGEYDGRLLTGKSYPYGIDLRDHHIVVSDIIDLCNSIENC